MLFFLNTFYHLLSYQFSSDINLWQFNPSTHPTPIFKTQKIKNLWIKLPWVDQKPTGPWSSWWSKWPVASRVDVPNECDHQSLHHPNLDPWTWQIRPAPLSRNFLWKHKCWTRMVVYSCQKKKITRQCNKIFNMCFLNILPLICSFLQKIYILSK